MITNLLDYAERAERLYPQDVAYRDAAGDMTFAQLCARARQVGTALARAVAPRTAVAVIMDARSAACVPVFLGALYAGCFYAPLDPALPQERFALIFDSLQPGALVFDKKNEETARAVCPAGCALIAADAAETDETLLCAIRAQASAEDLCTVLYTSGSTGLPKGVAHTQSSMIAYTEATNAVYGFGREDILGNQSPFFYANSIIDIFPPMALGARVYMIPPAALSFPKRLVQCLNEERVTELTMTPSSFVAVANAGVLRDGCLPWLRYIIMSGEVMPPKQLRQWMRAIPNGNAWNFYGSTEMFSVSVGPVAAGYQDGDLLPVGKPFSIVEIRFEEGEMYVHSPMIASGYYRDPVRSAEVFVHEQGKTWVRSGDYGYLNARGELCVTGRRDSMIKHHGYRMELGEVEAALRSAPGCREACCLYKKETDEIWCFADAQEQAALEKHLKARLARYMLPERWVLGALPHTATMKIDRKALAERMGEFL